MIVTSLFTNMTGNTPLLLLSRISHVQLCVTPWTAAHQAPLSTEFSRQEYWSGLPSPSPKLMIEENYCNCVSIYTL